MRKSDKIKLFCGLCVLAFALVGFCVYSLTTDSGFLWLTGLPTRIIALIYAQTTVLFLCFQTYGRIFPDSPILTSQKNIRAYRALLLFFASLPMVIGGFDKLYYDGKTFKLDFSEIGVYTTLIILFFLVAIHLSTLEYNRISESKNAAWARRSPMA